MKNAEKEIQEIYAFIGKKPYITTGIFETRRGQEIQITYHELNDEPFDFWKRLKFVFRVLLRSTFKP
jgi:hypothetical protein